MAVSVVVLAVVLRSDERLVVYSLGSATTPVCRAVASETQIRM